MISNRSICRFDQFDYESIGLQDRWYIYKTAEMLTSFEMEIKNYYTYDDARAIYNKINDKYVDVITNAIMEGDLPYLTPCTNGLVAQFSNMEPSFVINSNTTSFFQNSFIEYISKNNKTRIDIEKLKRFLSGEEAPVNSIQQSPMPEELSEVIVQGTDAAETVESHAISTKGLDGCRYRFESTDKGWSLQYDDVVLNGVKGSVGMDCIKYLLQRPGYKAGVIELETYLGAGNRESDELVQDETTDNVDDEMHGIEYSDTADGRIPNSHNNAWDAIDRQAVQKSEERLAQIDAEIKAARAGSSFNRSKIKRLEDDRATIENYLKDANYKSKDPQIEKVRKRIFKAIKEAVKKIRKLEELCNYNDRQISSHINRYIKTGSYCSYSAEGDNLPTWKF